LTGENGQDLSNEHSGDARKKKDNVEKKLQKC
jgi:hypothetical protein